MLTECVDCQHLLQLFFVGTVLFILKVNVGNSIAFWEDNSYKQFLVRRGQNLLCTMAEDEHVY